MHYYPRTSIVQTSTLWTCQLIEQLKVHYSAWEVQVNIKQTLSMSSATCNPLLKAARNPSRSITAPTLSTRELTINKPTKGFDTSSIQHPSWHLDSSSVRSVTQDPSAHSPMDVDLAPPTFIRDPTVTVTAATCDTIMRTLVHNRMTADVARAKPDPRPMKIRKRRTCAKCARTECSGSQKSSNCRNGCQDCKLTTCRGRNAKKPKKICSTPGLWD